MPTAYTLPRAACAQSPASLRYQWPVTPLTSNTATTHWIAARCNTRSVTCPAARKSLATRSKLAGDAATATAASSGRHCPPNPAAAKAHSTATKITTDCNSPISSTHGLRRNQPRWMRQPSSNNTSDSASCASNAGPPLSASKPTASPMALPARPTAT